MVSPLTEPIQSLYLHVPFCAQKCSYCAFYSHAPDRATVDRYVTALINELQWSAPRLRPETIFFGGGTPSILGLRQWERILKAMEALNLLGAKEWTVECNPATVSSDKARLLRSYGVNRISLGVQTLDEQLLDRLGRLHNRETVFDSMRHLRGAGFENINLDLMFAIPGQTLKTWRETLREALALEPDHLAAYELIYEEDTPLFAQLQAGEIDRDESLAEAMYEELLEAADHGGLRQYEVANFARAGTVPGEVPDYACRHNINYWRGGSYFGLGPSAAGYVGGKRTQNWPNTAVYCDQVEQEGWPVGFTEELAPIQRAGEAAAFGLRMNAGWPFELFSTVTGYDLRHEWPQTIRLLIDQGWGSEVGDRFQLTPLGLRFADAAGAEFLR